MKYKQKIIISILLALLVMMILLLYHHNKQEINVGEIVETPEQWKTKNYDIDSLKEIEVSTVYSVKVGDNQAVPVPYGFWYVGGTLESGVVISDNEVDKNKYVGQRDVPSGFELDGNDQPIYMIQGNQFVWIPCTEEEYHKTVFEEKFQNMNWDKTTSSAEENQIQKYGGFYVARFEAGLADSIPEFTSTQQHTSSNQIYNKAGKPQSKPGKIAWNFIDWNYSKENSENMYHTNYVNSGLITGTQWDVMLQNIIENDPSKSLTSSNWGNYYDQQLMYTGKSAKVYANEGIWYQEKSGNYTKNVTKTASSSSNPCYLLSTGASEQAKAYNLYDVAGNLWEWTEENSTYETTNQYRVLRGGSYANALATYPACYRIGYNVITHTTFNVGFRMVLYIK